MLRFSCSRVHPRRVLVHGCFPVAASQLANRCVSTSSAQCLLYRENYSLHFTKRWTTSEPGYTHFGHGRKKPNPFEYILYALMILVACLMIYTYRSENELYERAKRSAKAATKTNNDQENDSEQDEENESDEEDKKGKKPKMTFKDKKIISYENKIRTFSTLDKIFRYFATLKVYPPGEQQHGSNFEVFMTPDDFIRSFTPGIMQPEGLRLEQFATFCPEHDHLSSSLGQDSVFYKLGKHGLISYTDYVFLLTLISTSARHFSLAFKMFDINGDGELDYNEFERVETVIRHQTSFGTPSLDHGTGGSVLRRHTNSSLAAYFFGPNHDRKLPIDKFLEFQQHLQRDILKLEFERHNPENGRITEIAFCKMLLQHSGSNDKNQSKMLKRVKSYYAKKHKEQQRNKASDEVLGGLTLAEVNNFFRFLYSIADVDTALTFYRMAGAPVDPATLKHLAKTVAHVDIPDHVVEVVFALFDENQNGQLSNREFVSVMKRRLNRGLDRPKDTGFLRVVSAVWRCGMDMLPMSSHRH